MMSRRLLQITIVFLFMASRVCALTWDEAVTLATKNSNDIKAAQKQFEAFQWSYYKSFSPFLPQVSANLSAGEAQGSLGVSHSDSYGLSVSQSLFKGMGNYYNNRTAAVNLDFYNANLQNTIADYNNQVRLAFINFYIAQQNLLVREKILQARKENVRMIKLLYDSGKEDKGNYLRTNAQLATADYDVAAAMRQLELASLKLSQLVETKVGTVEGELKVGEVKLPDIPSLVNASPAYKMAQDQLTLAEISNSSTISGFLPSVSLNGSYSKSGSGWPPDQASKSLSLNVSWPIFPGGSNIADRSIGSLLLDKAKEDFAKSKKDLIFSINDAYNNFKDATQALEVQKIALDASTERARIAQSSYLNGLTTYTDWDLIQNDYISNQGNYLNSQRNALQAEANWYKSYGGYIK